MTGETLWYLSRAAGAVALLLMAAASVLGIVATSAAAQTPRGRYLVQKAHRSVSGLAVVFLGVHIVSAITDGYVELRFIDAVVPFASSFDPLWTGLGAVAVDLLSAITITSLLRGRVPERAWRAVHWTAYLLFPIGAAHALGISGGDPTSWWMLSALIGGSAAILGAIAYRAFRHRPAIDDHARQLATERFTAYADIHRADRFLTGASR